MDCTAANNMWMGSFSESHCSLAFASSLSSVASLPNSNCDAFIARTPACRQIFQCLRRKA
eukprot:4482280-Amphidinium_carterae.1